jgi:hypothetical protein
MSLVLCSLQAWVDDQVLAVLHTDLLALLFECELALSAAQATSMREARAGKAAHKAASSPVKTAPGKGKGKGKGGAATPSSPPRKGHGVRIAESDDAESKSGDADGGGGGSDAGSRPSAACEARLLAECRRNNAWKAILAIKVAPYRRCKAWVCVRVSGRC